jgi:hypothetical protein
MLYREIIAVCSQIHTKHINTLCWQNVELLNVKLDVHIVTSADGTYRDHPALKCNAQVATCPSLYRQQTASHNKPIYGYPKATALSHNSPMHNNTKQHNTIQ